MLRAAAAALGRRLEPLGRPRPARPGRTALHTASTSGTPHLDIWLICWANQQETGFHDHDLSAGAVHVVQGELVEDRFELVNSTLSEASTTHRLGATFDFDASHVHRLRHRHGAVATSIHAYSPALWRMGVPTTWIPRGLLRRTLDQITPRRLVPAAGPDQGALGEHRSDRLNPVDRTAAPPASPRAVEPRSPVSWSRIRSPSS